MHGTGGVMKIKLIITRNILPIAVLFFFALTVFSGGCGDSSQDSTEKLKEEIKTIYKPQTRYSEKEFKELAAVKVEGFKTLASSKGTRSNAMMFLESQEKNTSNMFASVMVSINNCFGCDMQKMDKDVWIKRKANLLLMLPRIHKENPDLVFEIDEMTIDSTRVITVYDLSYIKQERSTASSHSLQLFYNNGKIMLNITVSGRSRPFSMSKSLEELKTRFTKDEMKAAARKVFSALKAKI